MKISWNISANVLRCYELRALNVENKVVEIEILLEKKEKKASDPYHTAQPITLAAFPPWGSSPGAGCMGLALVGEITVKVLKQKRIFNLFSDTF